MRKLIWTLGLSAIVSATAFAHPVAASHISMTVTSAAPAPAPVVVQTRPATVYTPVTNPPNPSPYVHSGYYNPALNPGAAMNGNTIPTPYSSYGYGPYGYYSYGSGGGMAPELADQSPPGYNTVDVSASAPAPAAQPASAEVTARAALLHQVIGKVVQVGRDSVTLHSATAGNVTLYGNRSLVGLAPGELIVAWALPDGRWTSLTRVRMQE